jgi:hypothetical protein
LPRSPAAGEGESQGEDKSDGWQVFVHCCDHA